MRESIALSAVEVPHHGFNVANLPRRVAFVDGDTTSITESRVSQDVLDLRRLGVEQTTQRRFGLPSMIGFATTLMCTWESAIAFFGTAFLNGGGVSMIYGFIVAFIGTLATCASLAEMASMYPVSGGQYHWVALLAPPRYAKFLSWLTGWLSMLGWQAANATGTFLGGTIIQSLIYLNNPEFEPKGWQVFLILIATLVFALLVNTLLVKLLPGLEGLILIVHVIGFFAIMIPVVYLGPISSNELVWTQFADMSGYKSKGLSWLIAQSSTSILFIGYDGACHMAEEVKNAATNVPKAMMYSVVLSGIMGFATYIFLLYCIGDPTQTLDGRYGLPCVELLYNATLSKAGTTIMGAILVTMYIFATFGFMASSSRQAWAFSRDYGLPFSGFFNRVNNYRRIPIYAIILTAAINASLGLINIGSVIAFEAITSLVVSGFLSSYLIAILAMIHKRMTKEHIHFGPWNLGRWGLVVNLVAATYTLVTVTFSFFPSTVPVSAATMNWSCAVYGGVLISGVVYYAVTGHKSYIGPKEILED